jgi:hypothetical protein
MKPLSITPWNEVSIALSGTPLKKGKRVKIIITAIIRSKTAEGCMDVIEGGHKMNKQTGCNELIYANERITHSAEGSMNTFGNRYK